MGIIGCHSRFCWPQIPKAERPLSLSEDKGRDCHNPHGHIRAKAWSDWERAWAGLLESLFLLWKAFRSCWMLQWRNWNVTDLQDSQLIREVIMLGKKSPCGQEQLRPVSKWESQPDLKGYTAPASSKERPIRPLPNWERSQVSSSKCQLSRC